MIQLEIDCAPGTARPDFHYSTILTKIQESNFNNQIKELVVNIWSTKVPISKRFGNWTWELESLEDDSKNKIIVNFIYDYLKKSYDEGYIRYGYIDTVS